METGDHSEALIKRNNELMAFAAEAMARAQRARSREARLASQHVRTKAAMTLERSRAVALPPYLREVC